MTRVSSSLLGLALGLVVSAAPGAPADPEAKPAPAKKPAPPPRPPSGKRAVPDYDGRGDTPSTLGEDLLWVPRILVSPIYLTTEFVVRRPLGALISAAERAHVPEALYDFFFFGPDHKAGVLPTVYVDFGFLPSVGLLGFWNDAGFEGHDLTAKFGIWTSDWIAGSLGESFRLSPATRLSLKVAGMRRPDRAFYGLGPDTLDRDLGRYGQDWLETSGTFDAALFRSSHFAGGVGFRSVNLYQGEFSGDPSLSQQVSRGLYALPYGYDRGYTEEFNHARLALDTRRANGGSGVRFEVEGEQGSDVRRAGSAGWLRYQGTLGFFYDLNGRDRVLSLSGSALFADPLAKGGPIPFTELITLGGDTPMLSSLATGTGLLPGFYPGRLVDRSGAALTLRYRWPIWAWLDGSLQAAVGNVFGDHLDAFALRLLRMSGAIGIESTQSSETSIHLLVGFGSETFDHGGQVDSLRVAVGTTRF